MKGLGWIPDPPKYEDETPDFDFAQLSLTVAPAKASLRPFVVEVLDQGELGSCAVCAGFQAIRISHVRQATPGEGIVAAMAAILTMRNPPPLGSRLWGYYFARAIHHTTAVDSGTHLRSFFSAINKLGFPPESAWPYSDDKRGRAPLFTRQPKTNAFRLAADQRAPTVYRRIYSADVDRIADVKLAIAHGYAVAFGIDVDGNFCDNNFDPTKPLDPAKTAIRGGHALLVVGYNGDTFDVLNSWSDEWGDAGYFAASADFLAAGRDFWTVEHSPRYASEP